MAVRALFRLECLQAAVAAGVPVAPELGAVVAVAGETIEEPARYFWIRASSSKGWSDGRARNLFCRLPDPACPAFSTAITSSV
jgi:hypothetical protein